MLYYLSLGSNIGNREAILEHAIELIAANIGPLEARSAFYYSTAWGFESEHEFCNLCIAVNTPIQPLDMLTITEDIERLLGREEKSQMQKSDGGLPVYHDRTIDIDLLQAFLPNGEELRLTSPRLTLPHPLMLQRDFVMVPLNEIKK